MAREEHTRTRQALPGRETRGRTSAYAARARDYDMAYPGSSTLSGLADPRYLGSVERHNPEDLLVGALSACHMPWYLRLCAVNGVVVTAYEDAAEGLMRTHPDGSGEFTEVTLKPRATISAESDAAEADRLHVQKECLPDV